MATCNVLETEITNPDYINFLKVGHALSQFQKGIRPFITRELQAIHGTILANIGGQYCGTCTTDNILLHPKRTCRRSGCVCWDDPLYSRRPCPTGYCKQFYDELVQRHQYGTPQMKNVDISKMFRDYWQIAKCFLSPLCSSTITSAYDCDATALCSIIINCKQFEIILGIVVNLTGGHRQDVFSQVKGIRNETMYSALLEVAGQDMNTKLDTIVLALQCGPLTQDADTKRAANEIMKMKNSTFKVSRQLEKDVLEEKLKTLEEFIDAQVREWPENKDAKEKATEETVDAKIKATEKTVDVKMDAFEEAVNVKVDAIHATEEAIVKVVKKSVDDKQKATDTFLTNQQRDITKLTKTKVKLRNRLAVVKKEVVNLKQQVGERQKEADGQRDTLRELEQMISKHKSDIYKTQMVESKGSNKQTIFGKPFEYSCLIDGEDNTFQIPGSDVKVIFPNSLLKNYAIQVHGSSFRNIFDIRKRFDLPASEALASPVTEYHVTKGIFSSYFFSEYACVKMPFVGPRRELTVWKFPSDDDITKTTTRIQVPLKGGNSNGYLPDMFYEVEGSSTCLVYTRSFSCFYCTTDGRRPLKLRAFSYASHKRFQSTGSRPQHEVRIRMYIADEVMKFQDYKQIMDDIENMQDRCQVDVKELRLPEALTEDSIIEAYATPTDDIDKQWVHKPNPNSNEPIFPEMQTHSLRDIVQQCPNFLRCHLQRDEIPYCLEWYLTNRQGDTPPSLSFQGFLNVDCVDNQQKGSTKLVVEKLKMRQEVDVPAEDPFLVRCRRTCTRLNLSSNSTTNMIQL